MDAPKAALLAAGAAALAAGLLLLRRWPLINDVTTTPDAPPDFRTLSPGRPYPPAFAQLQARAYPDLAPLSTALPPAEAFARAAQAARAMPRWTVASLDQEALRLEAVAVTPTARFEDEVAVAVRPAAEGSRVHVRSRSRLGRGDFGENARRIRRYLAAVGAR